jgi:hypothetical protein
MKKGKFLFFCIFALLCEQTGVFAQVTIGSGADPQTTLDIIGDTATVKGMGFRLIDGNQGAGRFLVSDANGIGAWTQAEIHFFTVQIQPKKFTFYENPSISAPPGVVGGYTIQALTVSAASSDPGPIQYQWRKITNKNIHTPLSAPCGSSDGAGYNTSSFTPNSINKGDTRNANNTGMYRYFCRMTDGSGAVIDSDIAEVAVGCGAKNLEGEWVSFMCFNLGANENSTIASQRDYTLTGAPNDPVSGLHTYIPGEEVLFGDLFQWGRIADGHEKRTGPVLAAGIITIADIVHGKYCDMVGVDLQRPWNQISQHASGYGHFIMGKSGAYDWHPGSNSVTDLLWRPTGFAANDPCAHYKIGAPYHPFWNDEGNGLQPDGPACGSSGTAWRTPSQDEWGSIFRGGTLAGAPANALTNNWTWRQPHGAGTDNFAKGYGITPTDDTANLAVETLFLPASGYRGFSSNGMLYNTGRSGGYWSSSSVSTAAYRLYFGPTSINPAYADYRAYGFALRCIRN